MTEFTERRRQLVESRRRRTVADEELQLARARRQRFEDRWEVLRRAGRDHADDPEGARLLARQRQIDAAIEAGRERLVEAERESRDLFDRFADLASPMDLVEELDDSKPLLLLPVRLETRIVREPEGVSELWVRISPDELALDTHERPLTEDEVRAGRAYWREVHLADGDEELEKGAWRALVGGYGAPRAAWIVRATAPQSPTDSSATGAELDLPEPDPRVDSWSRAPRTRLLPDRFVVMTFVNGRKTHEVVGSPVPDPLVAGPDPQAAEESFLQQDGELDVDPTMRWMVDFDEAERVGMAVRISLSEQEAERGFDRVLALGVRLSADEAESRRLLEQLFEAHRYTDGLSFLAQGTPTNNTDSTGPDEPVPQTDAEASFTREHGPPQFTKVSGHAERSDGQRLAEALGVAYQTFDRIEGAGRFEATEAIAINRALWSATLGYFLEEMMDPVFDLDTIERVRAFFTRHVSGRGALPALQIGDQPYGVLPTTVFSRWRPPAEDDGFLAGLSDFLSRLDRLWTTLAQDVPRVGRSADAGKDLLEILGLHASSVEFYRRLASGPDYVWNLLSFTGRGVAAPEWEEALQEATAELVDGLGFDFEVPPKILRLSFFRHQSRITGPLIDEAPLSEVRPIEPISAEIGNYIEWLRDAADVATIRDQEFGVDDEGEALPVPRGLLYRMLRHALLLGYWDAANRLGIREGLLLDASRREGELVNLGREPDVTRWDHLELRLEASRDQPVGDFLAGRPRPGLSEAAQLEQQKAALDTLAGLPTARLERLFAEHLDLCSHRLDAWWLGLPALTLERLRRLDDGEGSEEGEGGGDSERTTGIFLGAYGWLDDLRPRSRAVLPASEIPEELRDTAGASLTEGADKAGFIHAPSLDHAATAAILRGGYLSHAESDESETMAVDLSSERVRIALWYLDGIRNGQPLAALLGYRLERGLHAAQSELDRFIAPLRQQFPLVADRLTPNNGTAVETLEARNVVDGLRLVRRARDRNYPYGLSGLPPAGSEEGRGVRSEIERIVDHFDALGDLALSESVFQMVQGNYERAGATLKSISEGGHPPEPDVVRTPRSGTVLTHRVTLNFDAASPSESSWPGSSPRADVEPQLNCWLGEMLGPPDLVACLARFTDRSTDAQRTVTVSLAELALQPLDFVYQAADELRSEATELERRIALRLRRAEGLADDNPVELLFAERGQEWTDEMITFPEVLPLATALREIVTGSRALGADDLMPPSEELEDFNDRRRIDAAELEERLRLALERLAEDHGALQDAIADAEVAPSPTPETLDELRRSLLTMSSYGISDAVPRSAADTSVTAGERLLAQTRAVDAEVTARRSETLALLDEPPPDPPLPDLRAETLGEAASVLFGRGFRVLPRFSLHNREELGLAVAASPDLLAEAPLGVVDEWLAGLTRVRPGISSFERARLLAELLDERRAFESTTVQLPRIDGERWLAVTAPEEDEIVGDKLCLVLHLPAGHDVSRRQFGLLIDEWTEVIPNRLETTGVAFHFDQPSSEPPQTMLLAVPPAITGSWSWDDLVDTLNETLAMAEKRGVGPEQLDDHELSQLAPAILSAFTRHLATISVDLATDLELATNE